MSFPQGHQKSSLCRNLLTLSQMTNFRLFQTEKVCRQLCQTMSNLKKMTKNHPNWVENTEGKGAIAHYEQFLLFPQCFQKAYTINT